MLPAPPVLLWLSLGVGLQEAMNRSYPGAVVQSPLEGAVDRGLEKADEQKGGSDRRPLRQV